MGGRGGSAGFATHVKEMPAHAGETVLAVDSPGLHVFNKPFSVELLDSRVRELIKE
jgi:hypothetical protein